jgi:hypothetical protein
MSDNATEASGIEFVMTFLSAGELPSETLQISSELRPHLRKSLFNAVSTANRTRSSGELGGAGGAAPSRDGKGRVAITSPIRSP